ncbi:MAG: exodeoxyribonuclease VII large subunit [Lachnobacterium sp.]|nr:exodeoxyribonuclease VII large subunit [Lachnobacterium sp.]MEE1033235.1 exodeoxyribonuclease VII large subunit [Agathobacter sp.]
MRKNIYPVGQVNKYIKNMFAQDFMLHLISIKGEVSNCKYHTSGHIYFTLKDKAGAMSAVMFAGNAKNMTFRMKDGDQVVVTGSVEVYEKMGTYQIYARQIELDGEGNLYLRFEQLKKELEEMGMFAAEYKRPIPKYAGKIGVVTAQTGAAIQDIRNISGRRNPYVQLILYPALVQGEGAAQSIVNGIHALDRMGLDIIIVGRGGGSIEDLWAFNEEIVARAIFECNTPVISAVGHETDWTIADFVSDRRAPTPSAAAELAVFDYRQMIDQLSNIKKRMDSNLSGKIEFYRERLSHIKTRVSYSSPANRLNENRKRLADFEERLLLLMQQQIKDKRQKLIMLSTRLDADSPVKKLSQGYAYVSKEDGRNIHSAADITCGDNIDIYLIDGRAKAVISEVDLNER